MRLLHATIVIVMASALIAACGRQEADRAAGSAGKGAGEKNAPTQAAPVPSDPLKEGY